MSKNDLELQSRFKKGCEKGQFQVYHIELEDLSDIEILERRKNLGKGELSSIAFANRTRQAFLTDDQKARKLAEQVMDKKMVQTIPQLCGWLFYTGRLLDYDKDTIVQEHKKLGRPLAKYIEEMYIKALEYKLVSQTSVD
jgi:predicted nucleic acid-binding protein